MIASSLRGAWRGLSWRIVASVAAMAFVWSVVIVATQTGYFTEGVPVTPAMNAVISMQLNGFAVLLAVLVADQASPPSRPRWWPYVVAVPVGVVVGTSAMWLVVQRVLHFASVFQLRGIDDGFASFSLRHGWHALMVCGMVTFMYAARRRAAQRATHLRELQRSRVEAERRVIEARLSAARARLEPEFLLRTLGDIESLYERDARLADNVLKELTAYLRATIPEMREPASTIETEVRLVSAYLNVITLCSRERLRLTAGHALAREARMPPMVLLPLVHYALGPDAQATLTLELARAGDRVVMTIRDKAGIFAPRHADAAPLREVRSRLDELHGAQARLTLQDDAPGSAVAVEFPLVTAAASSPAAAEHVLP